MPQCGTKLSAIVRDAQERIARRGISTAIEDVIAVDRQALRTGDEGEPPPNLHQVPILGQSVAAAQAPAGTVAGVAAFVHAGLLGGVALLVVVLAVAVKWQGTNSANG